MSVKKSLLIVILLSVCQMAGAQGLQFNGMTHRIQERTSFEVFGGRRHTFKDSLKLSFDLCFSPDNKFGYIFRVKDNCNWNLSYESSGDGMLLRLNEEGRISHIKAEFPKSLVPNLHWRHMEVCFDFTSDSLTLDFAGHRYRVAAELPKSMTPQIIFGKSDFLIDVPDFSIRELEISGSGRKYFFPLNQLEGETVYDSDRLVKGSVENPNWLMNDALSWKRELSLRSETIAGACWNPVRQQLCYFNESCIYVYDYMTGKVSMTEYPQKNPVRMKLGSNFISPDGNWLYSYELYDENKPEGAVSVARLNLDDFRWESVGSSQTDMPMNHHVGFFNPCNGEYTVFGGFGNMLYNGRFLGLDQSDGSWKERGFGGGRIFPRYFTSVGTDSCYVYVFGGMGNECGEQVVGRRYFYDLHRIDTSDGSIDCLWNLDWEGEDQVPVRRLIVDGDNFYTLCYPEYKSKSSLRLHRYSISDGDYAVLADAIPIVSDKMRTNANLYLDRDLDKFLAVVLVFDDDIKSELTLYTLNYPALGQEEIIRLRNSGAVPIWVWVLAAFALISIAGIAVGLTTARYRKRNRLQSYIKGKEARVFRQTTVPNAVYLFGDFMVTDRNGDDISSFFTPQLQTILVLLIQRNTKGIS
ncbi:MAG: DNA-binding transcriptional activator, partial [Candidatus Cryptobacteroides sp.]